MGKLPAFLFYPGDWMKDPAVRRCTPAARGVWMDMLCLMFECEERGVLASGGEPWSDREVAAVISGDTQDVLTCISELLAKGVVSRNQSGAFFSRRMVRDEQTRKQGNGRVRKYRCNADVTHDVTPLKRPSLETGTVTESVLIHETTLNEKTYDGEELFEQLCQVYPRAERGEYTKNKFWERVQEVAEKRRITHPLAAAWIIGRAKLYCERESFQAGMTKWLENRIYLQNEEVWGRNGGPSKAKQRLEGNLAEAEKFVNRVAGEGTDRTS